MANFNLINKRSQVLRTDPNFKKFVQELSRLKSAQENKDIKPSRITRAIYNQYNKYPELLNEIKFTRLGDELK
jgi:hypothetical protein